jgi:uncharacterized protein YggU (UPF0235/DUF167 family)|eukprot:COSAG06_NODE_1761_length_8450_cov_7621.426536_8_plen_486_part_00
MAAADDPDTLLECLTRQLSEVELLESMFPDECSVDSCVAAAAAVAEAAEEAGALPEGANLSPLTFTITVKLDGVEGEPELRLGFTLPPLYPRVAPLIVAGLSALGRKPREELAAALVATAQERTEQQGEDGEECICELVQQGQELATEMIAAQAEAAAAAASAGGGGDGGGGGALMQCVVRIDHMNDSKNYLKSLKKWCEQLGLAARVFYREAGTAKASGRVEGVVVVLEGPDDAVSGWLTRLRSEYVDVDGRGGKCKERKSTVMCRREAPIPAAEQEEEEAAGRLEGWEATAYEEEGTMETALAGMDLLHVGLGATRWGNSAASSSEAEPEPEPSASPAGEQEQADSARRARLEGLEAASEPGTAVAAAAAAAGAPPPYLEPIGAGSVMSRVHLSVEVSTGKQQTTLTNAVELQRRTATAARFDVAAQPRNGAANKALCAHLATALGVKSGDVSVASGHKARQKVIAVEGLPLPEVEQRLLDAA